MPLDSDRSEELGTIDAELPVRPPLDRSCRWSLAGHSSIVGRFVRWKREARRRAAPRIGNLSFG
jgi:hypothetical protein